MGGKSGADGANSTGGAGRTGGTGSAQDTDRPIGRRAEYAEATRRAIETAARELFVAKGYFGTTVSDIAASARVAPATVYAVGGGKQGLLRTVIESGTTAPVVDEILARIDAEHDPAELVRFITRSTRVMFEHWSDLMRVVTATAPHDPSVAQSLAIARNSQRAGFTRVANRLEQLGALAKDLDVAEAVDLMYFYLGNSAYFSLTDDNAWSLDKAEKWLADSLLRVLLD